MKLIDSWDSVSICGVNNEDIIMVSGGPTINWKTLKKHIKKSNAKVVCVKHSYPDLLAHGIQPYACVMLDPRPIEGKSTHGIIRSTLFRQTDPNTHFMIASMTDPSVTRFLQKKKVNIHGWHAYSQAVHDLTAATKTGQIPLSEGLELPDDVTFVTGGTCAAMRAIGMFHILGFRTFHLYGFDCCIPNITEDMKHDRLEDGRPKYMNVEVDEKKFWTTGELLAMGQDCEKLFNNLSMDMCITIPKGTQDTLVHALWHNSTRANQQHYKKLMDN